MAGRKPWMGSMIWIHYDRTMLPLLRVIGLRTILTPQYGGPKTRNLDNDRVWARIRGGKSRTKSILTIPKPLGQCSVASRDCVALSGEVGHGKRFFNLRGCAKTSTGGRRSTRAAALNRFSEQGKSSKSFGTTCAETAGAYRVSRNSELRDTAFPPHTSNP